MSENRPYYTSLLRELEGNEQEIFTFNELLGQYNLPENQLQNALETLVNHGLVSRVERGVYCRHTFRDEFVIGNNLVADGAVAYWSALNVHGLTEQLPNAVYMQTTRQKRNKIVFGVQYQFVRVLPTKIAGITHLGYGNHRFAVTNIEKTLVDCFDLPQYSGGFAELVRAFCSAPLNAANLIAYCTAIDNTAATKRMGFLAESFGAENLQPFVVFARSRVNQRYSLMDALGEEEGEFVNSWRLRLNVDREELQSIVNNLY